MNSDFIKGINKAIDAATGRVGGDYKYKYNTDTTRALDHLAEVIAGAAAAGMHFEVVDELPATGESNVIYLVPRTTEEESNVYDEYIWTENEGFEKIGSTDVDLSGYVTTDDLTTALNGYVEKVQGKGLSSNDFTDALLEKLNGIASGAEVNVQSDWNEADSSSDAFIRNKPTIPAAQVNADWNANSGVAQILNKPTIPSDLDDISDVTLTSPTDGQVLTYDQTDHVWKNADASSGNADFVELTNAEYIALQQAGDLEEDVMYFITDGDTPISGNIRKFTQNITAGSTQWVLTSPFIVDGITAWCATSIYGLAPKSVTPDVDNNTLTITFDPQNVDFGAEVIIL